jgi:lipooligosaccharide transport system ATP-binding protein
MAEKSTPTDSPVLLARDLEKRFGEVRAVDGVSFRVEPGTFFGLLGPNGAGKTSIIRMVYGFSPMDGGRLDVFGMDIRTHWRRIKARLGICQQENTLDPDLTVEQNLTLYAGYFEMPKQRARERTEELLDFFALGHKRHARVMELSGGMARRLMLARALINEPALLILDEPTTGLDPQSRHQVWDRLQLLRERNLSLLLTTHYMEEAQMLCDRLVIMDHGAVLVEGAPRELIREHAGESVIEVERPGDDLRAYVREQGVAHDDLGRRLLLYTGRESGLEQAVRERFCWERCTFRAGGLEDVFLRLTGRELRE